MYSAPHEPTTEKKGGSCAEITPVRHVVDEWGWRGRGVVVWSHVLRNGAKYGLIRYVHVHVSATFPFGFQKAPLFGPFQTVSLEDLDFARVLDRVCLEV